MGNPADHDELCPRRRWFRSTYVTCQCALIRAVEAREQERHGNNCGGLWDEWLTDLRAAVMAKRGDQKYAMKWDAYQDVLDLLDAPAFDEGYLP